MSKNTGGPAFPIASVGLHGTFGMTLRDYFAAQAMQGICANNRWNSTKQVENCARESYCIADAMLAERAK